jgi:serine/threonine-protein kinase
MNDSSPDPRLLRAERRIGDVLKGKWRLDRLIGVGGMAAVYAATHRNGKRVAVKVLHPEHAADAARRSRFLREGYVANHVDHEGAVSVLDDDVADDGTAFLVMELLDGESLDARAIRAGGRMPIDEVLAIAERVLDVLAAAHDKGIVHRDVKPENVFLTRAGDVKVLDFGIARVRELPARSGATHGSSLGTPSFMPPEQARGRWDEVDARSDVWALGATMFTLLTGQVVHEAATTNEVLLAAMTKAAPPVCSLAPSTPEAAAAAVDIALAFAPADRWPDARAMKEAVRLARATSQPPEVARLETPVAPAPPRAATRQALANPTELGDSPSATGSWARTAAVAIAIAAGVLAIVVGALR